LAVVRNGVKRGAVATHDHIALELVAGLLLRIGYWLGRLSEFRCNADQGHRLSHAVGPAPDAAELHNAALAYLARYAATEVGLYRVLERRIDRWARRATAVADGETIAAKTAAARSMAREVVARLVAAGAVNDVAYAESRARSLIRSGRSRRATAAHLAAKGVDPAMARTVLPNDDASELAAALVLARKRRIGPFRRGALTDDAGRRRELGMLARAGFPQDVARRALAMELGQAEALVNRLRR
jgi:regulatory protein